MHQIFLQLLKNNKFRHFFSAAVICMTLFQPALADKIIIAAFGDSLVHGFGLDVNEGFVPQLNQWLIDSDNNVHVINAGVSGDTTAGGLSRIDWTLDSNPDGLIIVLGGNDLLRGLSPEQSESNLNGILARIADADLPVLLIGQEAPENYGIEYKNNFDAIYPNLAQKYDTLFVKKFFAPLERDISREEARKMFIQDDGIHPNAAGVAIIIEAIGPSVLELIQQVK